jgi:phage baseplate assembly protein W
MSIQGFKYPIEINDNGKMEFIGGSGNDALFRIRQNIKVVLRVQYSTVFFNRSFGADINQLTFENIDASFNAIARDRLITAVEEDVPQATVSDITIQGFSREGRVNLRVIYTSNVVSTDDVLDVEVPT